MIPVAINAGNFDAIGVEVSVALVGTVGLACGCAGEFKVGGDDFEIPAAGAVGVDGDRDGGNRLGGIHFDRVMTVVVVVMGRHVVRVMHVMLIGAIRCVMIVGSIIRFRHRSGFSLEGLCADQWCDRNQEQGSGDRQMQPPDGPGASEVRSGCGNVHAA